MSSEEEEVATASTEAPRAPVTPAEITTKISTFEPTVGRRHLDDRHRIFESPHGTASHELMGPILRRKRVVSMPLGAGGDFFVSTDTPGPHRQFMQGSGAGGYQRTKQKSDGHALFTTPETEAVTGTGTRIRQTTPDQMGRQKQDSGAASAFFKNVVRRKQVSLDLLGPNDFFAVPMQEPEIMPELREDEAVEGEEQSAISRVFRPLRFAPRVMMKQGGGGHGSGHGGHGGGAPEASGLSMHSTPTELTSINEATVDAFQRYSVANQELRLGLMSMQKMLAEEDTDTEELLETSKHLLQSQHDLKPDEQLLMTKMTMSSHFHSGSEEGAPEEPKLDRDNDNIDDVDKLLTTTELDFDDSGIIRATKHDKVKGVVLLVLMLALTCVVASWSTELDEESFIFEPIGRACVTECLGNIVTNDFFKMGHNEFKTDHVIQLTMHLDAAPLGGDSYAIVEIVGDESKIVKATHEFGPVDPEERRSFDEKILVDFENPGEHHVINVYNSNSTDLSFTLQAAVLKPLADYSVLVAAIIMIMVYFFILIEVIHRTLVAIFGSMIALMFFFIMSGGETESIRQIMLNLEWSTLGLLFGMMLIVGELSHTGIFEWCAVRLLVASKGSFNRLIILLCTLTAVASAFLDNVTTMLLVAPVTIDMCNILDVDPRPYLIAEVILSNVGGTATLIGDPPNIIIGSSFEEIGFVDFIINLMPVIFLFCVPATLLLVLWIYRYYLTSTKMRILDTAQLKRTYPIYDEPRLMIAGTITFFVIVMFILDPVHHKDTAWIALLGAFICISFTNPHDVQDALRNHVEWDTLLFFAGLFVLVEVCAAMGLLEAIGDLLADFIESQEPDRQLTVAITMLMWVSAITSAFLDNIPYTATMIPVIQILHDSLPDTLPLETLAWALSLGACLGGNGTLLGASANIVTAGISTNKGFEISFLNFIYPGMMAMILTVGISNVYMLVRYVWI